MTLEERLEKAESLIKEFAQADNGNPTYMANKARAYLRDNTDNVSTSGHITTWSSGSQPTHTFSGKLELK